MEKNVIFGATGGMGSAIARRLNGKGYPLHLVARDKSKTEELSQELDASYTLGDVTDEAFFERVKEDGGRVSAEGSGECNIPLVDQHPAGGWPAVK